MIGHYRSGVGKAGKNWQRWSRPFNCRMHGTFNIRTDESIFQFRHAIDDFGGRHKFWLLRLDRQYYCYAVKWTGSRLSGVDLEIISRQPLPEELKTREIKIEVLEPWTNIVRNGWASKIHFFQTFPWVPENKRAANSSVVWDSISTIEYSGKSVLDIGCNFGYFSFKASNAGATVWGYDKNPNVIKVARTINDYIESQDVEFVDKMPEGNFDIIFYLSVHHQRDPGYDRLRKTLDVLKNKTREYLFFEDIIPPLSGEMVESEMDEIVGGTPLLKYRHMVRRTRKIWRIQGKAR